MGGGGYGGSHSIHKAKEKGPQSIKGVGSWDARVAVLQGNRVGSWRWPCGFAHHY